MSIVTGMVIALIVSVVLTLIGGVLLTVARFYKFLEPISWTTLALGGVGTIFVGINLLFTIGGAIQ